MNSFKIKMVSKNGNLQFTYGTLAEQMEPTPKKTPEIWASKQAIYVNFAQTASSYFTTTTIPRHDYIVVVDRRISPSPLPPLTACTNADYRLFQKLNGTILIIHYYPCAKDE